MGDTLGHYALLEQIGVGGLGDVYRARDTKLGRTTAIKVIRPELAADSNFRRQFLRQTSALRSLSHPNIATLFDVGEDNGRLFLAIEWVVGEPLRTAVAGRALNVRRAVDFGVELADALADGHAQTLVHGDITSDTVVLTPTEHAKLLDFGLSAWTRGGEIRRQLVARRAAPTKQALHAARYLSPEQAVGKRCDHRADIFSLGVVLYEMLTGRSPFGDTSWESVVQQVAAATPIPPSQLNAQVPPELDAILNHALAKRVADRFQSAASLAAELRSVGAILDIRSGEREPPTVVLHRPAPTRRWRTALSVLAVAIVALAAWAWRGGSLPGLRWLNPPPRPVMLVLPLDAPGDQSGYYASGLTRDLVTRLGQTPGLTVVGREAVRGRRGVDPVELARALDAGVVLRGSVQVRAGVILVDLELDRVENESLLWSDRFERDADRVFALQADIVEAVARALRMQLEPSTARARKQSHVVNPAAYDFYLRGLAADAEHDSEQAMTLYEQAIALDAGLAEAHAGLAVTLHDRVTDGASQDSPPTFARIEQAALQALATDPDLPAAHLARGLAAATLSEALSHVRRAVEIDPSYADGYRHIGDQILPLDPLTATRYFDRALSLDPGLPRALVGRALALARLGRFEEAASELSRGRAADPDRLSWAWMAATLSFDAGRYNEGLSESAAGPVPEPPIVTVARASALQAVGRTTDALVVTERTVEQFPDFCEGRSQLAALRFTSGNRVAAIQLADAIFERAGRPDRASDDVRCAVVAAAAIQDPDRVGLWLGQVAADEGTLRAWIRQRHGISTMTGLRRGWFPWGAIAGAVVDEAVGDVERAEDALRRRALQALDGLPETVGSIGG